MHGRFPEPISSSRLPCVYTVASSPTLTSICGALWPFTTSYSTKCPETQSTCYTFFCLTWHVTLTNSLRAPRPQAQLHSSHSCLRLYRLLYNFINRMLYMWIWTTVPIQSVVINQTQTTFITLSRYVCIYLFLFYLYACWVISVLSGILLNYMPLSTTTSVPEK